MATDEMIGKVDEMIGQVFANQWEIVDALGEGGVGSVYLAKHRTMETYVAIKFLNPSLRGDPESIERFKREVDVLKRSAHPNIGVIHDCDLTGENPFIVMEFLEGQILKEVLDETPGRRLHPQRVRRIFIQILSALGTVHDRGVIHRDLKPENIFVLQLGGGRGNRDVVKLIDFGIGKVRTDDTATKPNLTQVGLVVGTPFYMSPEQCRGEKDVDGRTDLYAVGAMLYECVTGQLLFNKPTLAEIMVAHLNEHPAAPKMLDPSISSELEAVIFRALAKKAELRFQTAEEFGEALEAAILEDPAYYRNDSRRVPTVTSRAIGTPPRIPTPADDDQPTAERPKQPPDVSKTPTRLLSGRRPAPGLALARTATPSSLKREILKAKIAAAARKIARSVWAWMAAVAWGLARRADPWLSRPRPPYARYLHASLILVIAFVLSLIVLPPAGGGDANASSDTAAASTTTGDQQPDVHVLRDVIVIRAPVPIATPPEHDAGTTEDEVVVATEAFDAGEDAEGEDATEPEAIEAEGEAADSPTPPDDYAERLAAAELKEKAGDDLLLGGKLREALAAYREALDLLPEGTENDKVRLQSKIGRLERRLK